ncbi:MAG: ABC transporter permease [Planctomycetota bacterium]
MSELVRGRSLWQDALRRLRRNTFAVVGGVFVVALVVACVVVPKVVSHSGQNTAFKYQPPGSRDPATERLHLFGTDELGRDLFARTFYGGRISLLIGFVATLVAVVIGTAYGAIAGFAGGRVDNFMMRIVDVLYGLPYMFLVILILVVVGRGLIPIFAALGLFNWLTTSRIVRGQILTYKNMEFVQSARTIGASSGRIVFRHLLPNVIGPVIVYSTLSVPSVILLESFLSFLGLGVQEPHTSWGQLAAEGTRAINAVESNWWVLAFPVLFLAITLLSLNFAGDGLRDALDPKGKRA